jgi:GNAT superfamily N-acetyltransferase
MAVIRRAALGDVDLFLELWLALHGADPQPERAAVRVSSLHRYFAEHLSKDVHVWVAEEDDQLVACCGLVLQTRPPTTHNLSGLESHILNMYTRPEYRGRGIGTRLVNEALAAARELGAGRVRLDASDMGRPVYEKAGFVPNGAAMQINFF